MVLMLLVCSFLSTHAQTRFRKWGVGVGFGVATYSMNDLTRYLEERSKTAPYGARVVKTFPAYINTALNVSYLDSVRIFEVFVGRTSTGGRLSYADRTGQYADDLLVIMGYSGAGAAFRILNTKYIDGFAGGQLFCYVNRVKETVSQEIYNNGASESSVEYVSVNFGVAPVFELQSRWTSFAVRFQCSYELHAAGSLVNTDNPDAFMTDRSGSQLSANGSGLRVKLGITYLF
jgi:hypothetical protein